MSLISKHGLKQIDDLLLSDSHDVELSAHLGEAVVDMRTKVDEVLSKGIETRSGGMAEIAKFAMELTYVAVGGSGENARGRRVLLTCLHPPG